MKENPSKHKTDKTLWVKIISMQDIITTCPKCGGELGIWSEDNETLCIFCDLKVFEKENILH
jgi:hypothetical protein